MTSRFLPERKSFTFSTDLKLKIYSLQLHLHAYQIGDKDPNGLQYFLHDSVGYYLWNLTVF